MNKSQENDQNTNTSLIWVVILLLLMFQLPFAFSQVHKTTLAATANDQLPPIARCINGTGLAIPATDHSATLWAADVNQFSIDNESVADMRLGLAGIHSDEAPLSNYVAFTEQETGKHALELWVSDPAGNWGVCTTYVYVYKEAEKPNTKGIAVDVVADDHNSRQRDELYQNSPNPYKAHTKISFFLADTKRAVLRVLDSNGRIIKKYQGPFNKGFNEIILSENLLSGHQMMYYQLETASGIQSRKMIPAQIGG